MKKRSISLIIGLMSVALLGVMAMQVYFMWDSYRLKTELFNQSVNAALTTVASKLEKQDAFNFLDSKEREQQERLNRTNMLLAYSQKSKPVLKKVKGKNSVHTAALSQNEKAEFDTSVVNTLSANVNGQKFFFSNKAGSNQFSHNLRSGVIFTRKSNETDKQSGADQNASVSRTGIKNYQSKYSWPENPGEKIIKLIQSEQSKSDSLFELQDSLFRKRFPNVFSFRDVKPENGMMNIDIQVEGVDYKDEFGRLRRAITRVTPQNLPTSKAGVRSMARKDSIAKYLYLDPSEGEFKVFIAEKPKVSQISVSRLEILGEDFNATLKQATATRLSNFISASEKTDKNAIASIATEFQAAVISLDERMTPYIKKGRMGKSILDSLLSAELKNKDINIPFKYLVSSARKDSVIFSQISNREEQIPENMYQTRIFSTDVIRDAGLLTITFPDKNSAILSKMTATIGSSAALLMVLLFCFGYTIHSILRQKKISEMKNDFINNMTHEFKTPVATIMLASEALKDPDIIEDPQRTKRFAGIIYDENVRLGNHIERVLNIAKIEKEDLKLDHKPVEVNDLVAAVTDSMTLQFQKKNVKLNLDLKAEQQVIAGDELHLSNVIFNLVDNAIKYSKEDPEVSISTFNAGKNLVIRVADKGIGMNREYLSKIFDQFYRIPTGNLHDVKGFGLGLNYVSNIVRQLNGSVKVRSEKDKGSEFDIILPLV